MGGFHNIVREAVLRRQYTLQDRRTRAQMLNKSTSGDQTRSALRSLTFRNHGGLAGCLRIATSLTLNKDSSDIYVQQDQKSDFNLASEGSSSSLNRTNQEPPPVARLIPNVCTQNQNGFNEGTNDAPITKTNSVNGSWQSSEAAFSVSQSSMGSIDMQPTDADEGLGNYERGNHEILPTKTHYQQPIPFMLANRSSDYENVDTLETELQRAVKLRKKRLSKPKHPKPV